MKPPIFITGIGTGVGKTLAAAVIVESLEADYWKPVQAGLSDTTDSELVRGLISNKKSVIHPETYRLITPASPHIAARLENRQINLAHISNEANSIKSKLSGPIIVEGAGGLLVPLNENETVLDLVRLLDAKLIVVSRNYLGSINHSLLTASKIQQAGIKNVTWLFNDQFMSYEEEIVQWSGMASIGSIPACQSPDKTFVRKQAEKLLPALQQFIEI